MDGTANDFIHLYITFKINPPLYIYSSVFIHLLLLLLQSDLQVAEESNASLTSTLQSVQEELTALREAKVEAERRLQEEKGRLEEDVETLKWQLGQKEAREEELVKRLVSGGNCGDYFILLVSFLSLS